MLIEDYTKDIDVFNETKIFKLDISGLEIKVVSNSMLPENTAILSHELYEMVKAHLLKICNA